MNGILGLSSLPTALTLKEENVPVPQKARPCCVFFLTPGNTFITPSIVVKRAKCREKHECFLRCNAEDFTFYQHA